MKTTLKKRKRDYLKTKGKGVSFILLLCLSLSFFVASSAFAQLSVRIKMTKDSYILNEPVTATITITNYAGRDLILRGGANPWLNFTLFSAGRSVSPARKVNYKPVVIPSGQTVSREVSLSSTYSLDLFGNYVCVASVSMPGDTRNAFLSNRAHFTVTKGRTSWSQRVGVPGASKEIRKYELLLFSGNRAMELFAQVSSVNTGQNIRTFSLGKILSFRRPTVTLDKSNNMHVLYQVKPNLFRHACISLKGKLLFVNQYKRGKSRDPRLIRFGDGEVKVAGGIPYNAKAAAELRRTIHNITERPSSIYR